jgi:beta-carotene 3-hydroxylase
MIYVITAIISFFFMEIVAWFTHKYIMHGFGWYLHRDHHIKEEKKSFFEKNDVYVFIYVVPAVVLIVTGLSNHNFVPVSIGIGFTLYGLTYFLIHEVVIHKRFRFNREIRNKYLSALIRAHEAHHVPNNRSDFRCFGLLIFPRRFFK